MPNDRIGAHNGGYLRTGVDRRESLSVARRRGPTAGNTYLAGRLSFEGPIPDLRRCLWAGGVGQGTVQAPIEVGKVEMAQKVSVVLEDDLTGGPAKQTVRFAFDGTGYEIDLNAKNAAAFGKQLAPYLEHARKAGRAPARRAGRAAAGRQRSGDIRAWAKEQGLAVSGRGRIPASVLEQYHAATDGR